MKTMKLPLRWNSLFTKLLLGFLSIIALLLSFNVLSFAFFKTNVQQEIIRHNRLNLNNTAHNYDNHFQLVESVILRFYFNDRMGAFRNAGNVYKSSTIDQFRTEMNTLLSNPMLYLDNIIFYSGGSSYVLEKDGTGSPEDMFGKYYVSPDYDLAFWNKQLTESYSFRIFPASTFKEIRYDNTEVSKGTLLPVVIKNKFNPDLSIIALLGADKLFQAFHYSGKDAFYILDADGRTLFRSFPDRGAVPADLAFPADAGFVTRHNDYYFYQKGESGLIYVNVIPNVAIASQVSRLNWLLLGLLCAAVVISALISVRLSFKFNHPIRNMIAAMQRANPQQPKPAPSNIHEFDWISDNISHMIETNDAYQNDLHAKNRLLQNYGYINKIKRIYQKNDLHDLIKTDAPFYLIVFQIVFSRKFHTLTAEEQGKAAYYIKEYIDRHIAEPFAGSVTLQMEKDQILSLVFADVPAPELLKQLQLLKEVLDRDREFCFLTIAVVPERRDSAALAAAYEQAVALTRQRLLNEATQIITEPREERIELAFTASREQELLAALQAGQPAKANELLRRLQDQLDAREAGAREYERLAKEVVTIVTKALLANNLDIGTLFDARSPYEHIRSCTSREHFDAFFEQIAGEAIRLIQDRKAAHDPISDFVMNYLDNHYGEELTVELVAEKLNLSRAYLSTYFREKTGTTFSDYLNGVRISRAKELLRHKDVQIKAIAAEVGYLNVNSFIRMFKSVSGLTPNEYRRTLMTSES
ncbi:MAG: helix-turn-helix domain-containing protein [Paenibacillaceae bacterium]|nr:helix-turn-helix domain-containing protein [Paenibacillaceae bacterium]